MNISVPDMSFEESFGYSTVLGLALGDYTQDQTMINVLPDGEKKKLRHEYRIRLASILFSFLALSGAIAIFLVLPSYFFSVSKSNIATARLEAFNRANPEIATSDIDKSVADINAKLALLSAQKQHAPVTEVVLKDFTSNLPAGIALGHILYDESPTGSRIVEIHGTAADRTTLRNFKSSLDANPDFASVNLPISDFIEKTNIAFTISITMK